MTYDDLFPASPALIKLAESLARLAPERLEEMRLEGEALSRDLARRGWAMPMNIQPVDAWEALENAAASGGDSDLDAFFVAHYTSDGGRHFDELAEELATAAGFTRMRPLLLECIAAYRRGQYRITIPSLLLAIEGAVGDLGGRGAIVKSCRRHFQNTDPDRVSRMIWSSVTPFIETIFEDGRTASSDSDIINRNAVLHGRSEPGLWTVADSLRLFCALHAIALVGP